MHLTPEAQERLRDLAKRSRARTKRLLGLVIVLALTAAVLAVFQLSKPD